MIYLLLAKGFEEVEALTPLDLLRRAGKTVLTVSITEERAVCGAHGITVLADLTADELTEPCDEMLILPGGMPGTRNLEISPVTDRLIREVLEREGHIAAICAAPMILGRRGLLEDKMATCYPGFEEHLLGAELSPEPCVTDGNITTASGAGTALLFAAELVRILCGGDAAEEVLCAIREPEALKTMTRHNGMKESEWYLMCACSIALETGKVSTSLLQRRLSIGFGKAARLIDQMEALGYVSPPEKMRPRDVYLTEEQFRERFGELGISKPAK